MTITIDPVTFEILRHRMWGINDEAGATLRLVSGSPVANEAFDYNTAIMNAKGEVMAIGAYITLHAISLEQIVKDILEEYGDNPGIHEDDMFFCNDPYVGAMHQSDVAVVAPVHWNGELIAWTGAVIHQVDMGGPGRGQVSIGATSIFEEAPVFPPLKLVEKGTLLKDVERSYLRRSRLPELLGLDLKAKIACNNVAKRRIKELCELKGVDTIKAVIVEIINYTENRLRSRLKELPDGTWRHISFLDYEQKIYETHLAMTKGGDSLTFDFTGTSPQAAAVINCTYAGLRAAILTILLEYLCYDMPWCPAGAMRTCGIVSQPGTVIHARWPAGVCKATTAGSWAVVNTSSACLSKMLAASDKYRNRAMAVWKGSSIVEELFGVNQRGDNFGATILDFMAGGGGARVYKDGIDTGGFLSSVACAVANAETYEFRYPMLYLSRRQEADTGGPGKFRGGVAMRTMYICHGADEIAHKVIHGMGLRQPDSVGINGGYPANTHVAVLKRATDVEEEMKQGRLPQDMDEVSGKLEVMPAMIDTPFRRGDVYSGRGMGGGGYGDPIERDPSLVARDVANKLVSVEAAWSIYGVRVNPETATVNSSETQARRQQIREQRKGWKPIKQSALSPRNKGGKVVRPVSENLSVVENGGQKVIRCRCGQAISPAGQNYREYALFSESPIQKAGPHVNEYKLGEEAYAFREYCCPGCYTLLDAEIALKGAPILWDAQLKV